MAVYNNYLINLSFLQMYRTVKTTDRAAAAASSGKKITLPTFTNNMILTLFHPY